MAQGLRGAGDQVFNAELFMRELGEPEGKYLIEESVTFGHFLTL